MEELWKDIPGYEGLYQASNLGRIRITPGRKTISAKNSVRVWKAKVMHPKKEKRCRNLNGYTDERVDLWKNGTHRTMLVSRIVAMTWVDGYEPNLTVNHIDGNPSNNTSKNLEWVTVRENVRKGFQEGLFENLCKDIALVSQIGEIHYFSSLTSANSFLGRGKNYIRDRINQKFDYAIDSSGNLWLIRA